MIKKRTSDGNLPYQKNMHDSGKPDICFILCNCIVYKIQFI